VEVVEISDPTTPAAVLVVSPVADVTVVENASSWVVNWPEAPVKIDVIYIVETNTPPLATGDVAALAGIVVVDIALTWVESWPNAPVKTDVSYMVEITSLTSITDERGITVVEIGLISVVIPDIPL